MRRIEEREQEIRKSRRRRQRELRRKVFGFCAFTFLLGVLFGRIVFAKDPALDLVNSDFKEELGLGDSEMQENGSAGNLLTSQDILGGRQEDSWKMVLVNRNHAVEEGYEPPLEEIENNYYFDARAVEYLQKMLADGRKEGLDFWVCSAYRTIEKQTNLFEQQVRDLMAQGYGETEARKEAATAVAYPGTSEHNLGLAVDIVARDYQILDEKQADTEEARWLEENCWKYGFILRYPTDKTEITGIIFEPWHYRYVGEEAAKEIMERGICLEEYLGSD